MIKAQNPGKLGKKKFLRFYIYSRPVVVVFFFYILTVCKEESL